MRIIGGKLKGKKIFFVKSKITRPLRDAVKENIFNIINHSNKLDVEFENSRVLDFYSGIGSFGLECISRGAKKVMFIERDPTAKNILKKNLDSLSISEKASIESDITNLHEFVKKDKFNIFFFDPPYKDNLFIEKIKMIKENNLFDEKNILIIHRENRTNDNFENYFKIIFLKNYGRSKIIFGKLAK